MALYLHLLQFRKRRGDEFTLVADPNNKTNKQMIIYSGKNTKDKSKVEALGQGVSLILVYPPHPQTFRILLGDLGG